MPKNPPKKIERPVKKTKEEKPEVENEEVAGAEDVNETSPEEGEGEEAPERLQSSSEVENEEVQEADYIRKYQYKKVNDVPTIGGPQTDPDASSKAARMKEFLLTQRRISVLIPLPEGSDPKVPYSVNLNGYRLDLPMNAYVDVPEQVAEVIRQSNNQTIKALDQHRIDDSKEALR